VAAVKQDGLWGFIDNKGKFLIPARFTDAMDFRDGMVRVKLDGKWGYVDAKGTLAIPPQFDYCWDFSNGKAKGRITDGSIAIIDRAGKPAE
jgi:hypothetical protein